MKQRFGIIKGEQHKRVPEEFQSIAAKEPLIANKQFYFNTAIKADIVTKPELPDTLMEYYLAGKKLNTFLISALKK